MPQTGPCLTFPQHYHLRIPAPHAGSVHGIPAAPLHSPALEAGKPAPRPGSCGFSSGSSGESSARVKQGRTTGCWQEQGLVRAFPWGSRWGRDSVLSPAGVSAILPPLQNGRGALPLHRALTVAEPGPVAEEGPSAPRLWGGRTQGRAPDMPFLSLSKPSALLAEGPWARQVGTCRRWQLGVQRGGRAAMGPSPAAASQPTRGAGRDPTGRPQGGGSQALHPPSRGDTSHRATASQGRLAPAAVPPAQPLTASLLQPCATDLRGARGVLWGFLFLFFFLFF